MHPPALCQAQAAQPNIELLSHHEALELRKVDGQWQALDGDRVLASAPVVVLAGAAEIKRFAHSAELPLKRIRGQITRLPQTTESQSADAPWSAPKVTSPRHAWANTPWAPVSISTAMT